MRTEGVSAVSGIGKYLPSADSVLATVEMKIHIERLVFVLMFAYSVGNPLRETVEVPVNSHVSVVMHYIQGIAVTSGLHACPAYIAVGDSTYRLADNSLRLEIDTRMKMIGTEFSEIAAQYKRKVKRHAECGIRSLCIRQCGCKADSKQ